MRSVTALLVDVPASHAAQIARAVPEVRTVPVSGEEQARQVTILFSADGRRLYAAETGRNQVAEIDMATGAVLRRLPTGRNGDGLAIAPARR